MLIVLVSCPKQSLGWSERSLNEILSLRFILTFKGQAPCRKGRAFDASNYNTQADGVVPAKGVALCPPNNFNAG
jgi:hypothetical protein